MPLQTRPTAIKLAVIAFFIVAIFAKCNGISSFTCSKRALIAAIIIYIATTICIKIINMVLINAMVEREINRQKDIESGS